MSRAEGAVVYQPFPSGSQQPVPQPPGPPQPVRTAVLLMYAGAALRAIVIIFDVTRIAGLTNPIWLRYPGNSSGQIHTTKVVAVSIVVVTGLIAIGAWIWMARANGAGRTWARVVGCIFFGINTLGLLSVITRPHAASGLVLAVLMWLAGLGAIVLLWRRESSAYYQAGSVRVS